MAFIGLTNTHGPSPQSRACRSSTLSITTITGNCLLGKVYRAEPRMTVRCTKHCLDF